MTYNRNERLEIDWLDVVDDPNWRDESDTGKIPSEAYSRSVGYFFKEDNVAIWLSPSINHRKKNPHISPPVKDKTPFYQSEYHHFPLHLSISFPPSSSKT